MKISKSVASELKEALGELFEAMELKSIMVEGKLEIDCLSFTLDLLRVLDEIRESDDIVKLWHIDKELSVRVFSVLYDVLFGGDEEDVQEAGDNSEDEEDLAETDDTEDDDVSSIELNDSLGNSEED